jgi:DNA helicase-2/ATP-dependent DNA helicase PcrA
MEEELFPSPFVETPRELEEERRLFYVAITRAEERCFISYAKSRFKNGKTNFSNPSRFLKDIDSRYLDVTNDSFFSPPKPQRSWDDEINIERNLFRKENQPQQERFSFSQSRKLNKISPANSQPSQNTNLPIGCFVKHELFGIGKVLETSITDGNEKAKIDFGEKGVKSLLLKFAKLEVLK